ncbi:unnamed protein product [Scytosiphon promiscuus]
MIMLLETRHTRIPLIVLLLLVGLDSGRATRITVDGRTVEGCDSDIAVASSDFPGIAGCYRKTNPDSDGLDVAYVKKDAAIEGNTYHILGAWDVARDKALSKGGGKPPVGSELVEFCGGARVWDGEGVSSPTLVECTASPTTGRIEEATMFQSSLTVSCGCHQGQNRDAHVQSMGIGAGASGGDDSTHLLGGGLRGVGSSSSKRTSKGLSFSGASGGLVGASRALEDDVTGSFERFWLWVIVAAGTAGLIVLCCIGWYIRNPFFCQKNPPADPEAQAEDAAPQAPKTAFQPWGASAPPM